MIQFQEYLQSDYPGFASFIDTIIKPIFGDAFVAVERIDDLFDCFENDPEELQYYDLIVNLQDNAIKKLADESGLERILKLGTIHVKGDSRPIHVYDITVNNRRQLSRNRKGIQQLITRILNNQSGAFMLFHYNDEKWEWRFCYKYVGKDKEDTTDSKRFTYLLGRDQVCKTAAQRFTNLLNKKGQLAFDDITEAFSVEKVSKEFFEKYKAHYERLCQFVYDHKSEPEWFGQEFVEWEAKAIRDYVKKMMGRIVFLHFIQKKGWMGVPEGGNWGDGDQKYMQHLFENATEQQKSNFLDEVMEPLFKEMDKMLCGGLFENDIYDKPVSRFKADDFKSLFEFLGEYNFTIDENDPADAEVGVDPEMLGRIFENLLEDNKDKGAFYTPKEIVHYMCRESLIAYLQTDVEDEGVKQSFRDFVTTHEVTALNPADVYKIDKKLREVKICDPAIGSGAFPMGLLKELFDCRMAIEGVEDGKTPAEIKKDIIQNSIYGVDIEKGAVDIARLRFWLSLILDEQTPHALPNMDFKIMQGNSLLEQYEDIDLSGIANGEKVMKERVKIKKRMYDMSSQTEFVYEGRDAIGNLQIYLKDYFSITDHQKKEEYKRSINQAIHDFIRVNLNTNNNEVISKLENLPIPNDQFFLWHTYFKEVFDKGGFDIVIGNPPYIQLQADSGKLGNLYKTKGFETFAQTGDIYSLFYEFGVRMLREKGHLVFITSNTWMRAAYGEATRKFFINKTNPLLLLDFSGIKLFESATVETNILLLEKNTNRHKTKCLYVTGERQKVLDELYSYVENNYSLMSFNDSNAWVILNTSANRIKNKIETIGTKLCDWEIQMFRGLTTGYNDAYCVTTQEKDEILNCCSTTDERNRTEELFFKLLRGRDLKHYYHKWSGLWVMWIPWHFPHQFDETIEGASHEAEEEFYKYYPTLYHHLTKFKTKLSARNKAETGIRYEWYALQRWGAKFWKEFLKPKIVWLDLCDESRFSYNDDAMPLNTVFFITGDNLYSILGILNSKLVLWYFKNCLGTTSGVGTNRWLKYTVEQLPIYKGDSSLIANLSKRITESKKLDPQADTSALEAEIDHLVYDLYGLTEDEIKIVEGKN